MPRRKKGVYRRVCANHPETTENLRYVYNGIPDHKSGQLLCKECLNDRSETPEREVSNVRESNDGQETSSLV